MRQLVQIRGRLRECGGKHGPEAFGGDDQGVGHRPGDESIADGIRHRGEGGVPGKEALERGNPTGRPRPDHEAGDLKPTDVEQRHVENASDHPFRAGTHRHLRGDGEERSDDATDPRSVAVRSGALDDVLR